MKKVLEAVAERVIAAEGIGVSASDLGVANAMVDYIDRLPAPIQKDIRRLVFLFGLDSFPRVAATEAPLVFTLNGFSKMFALPGVKIGWMTVTGKEALVKK